MWVFTFDGPFLHVEQQRRKVWREGTLRFFFASLRACGLTRLPQQQLPNQEHDPQQEYNNGDLVDAVHHLDVDVGWAVGIFLAEEIVAYFAQGKEFLYTVLFLFVGLPFILFHNLFLMF